MTTKTHPSLCACKTCGEPREVEMTYEFRKEWNKDPRYEIKCGICGRSTDYHIDEDDCLREWTGMNK